MIKSKINTKKEYKLLVCRDFEYCNIEELKEPETWHEALKMKKEFSVKNGDVLEMADKKGLSWWITTKKTEIDLEGNKVIKYLKVPSSILIPIMYNSEISFDNEFEFFNKIRLSQEEKISIMPDLSQKDIKYFPLVYAFYRNLIRRQPCPVKKANIFSRIFYSWMTAYVLLGSKRYLFEGDLWQPSSSRNVAKLANRFASKLNEGKNKNMIKCYPLFTTFLKLNKKYVIYAILCKFLQDIIKFSVPFIIRELINYVKNGATNLWVGILLAISLFVSNEVNSLLLGKYFEFLYILGAEYRCILVSCVSRKMFRIPYENFRSYPLSHLSNLVSVDAYRIEEMIVQINMLWSIPLQIILCIIYLSFVLGLSTLPGLGITVLIIPLNILLGRITKHFDQFQVKLKDKRLSLVTAVISGIKLVKFYAWEEAFQSIISKIRKKELKAIFFKILSNTIVFAILFLWPVLITLVSFPMYIYLNGKIDAAIAFESMAIFNILRFPIVIIPYTVMTLVSGRVSYKRFKSFLSLNEINPNVTSYCVTPSENYENSFVKLNDAQFCFSSQSQPFLCHINLIAVPKSLHIIIGPNGSGKTVLLQSLINETFITGGSVNIQGTIAYVPQQPWIRNTTVRDNILDDHPYIESQYMKVLRLCQLESDLAQLSGGDLTEIGEKGVNLSGGQKQRIGLARAIYSDSSIYLLDDPFSALDTNVRLKIFNEVVSGRGFLANRIRILTTHCCELLKHADYLHIMENGKITQSGTYNDMLKNSIDLDKYLSPFSQTETSYSETERLKSFSCYETFEKNLKGNIIYKDLIKKDNLVKGSVKVTVYVELIKSMTITVLFVLLIVQLILSFLNVIGEVYVGEKTSNNITRKNWGSFLFIFGLLAVAQVFLSFAVSSSTTIGNYFSSKSIHEKLLKSLLRAPISFFESIPAGRLLDVFSKEMSVIDSTIFPTFRQALWLLFGILATLSGVVYTLPYLIIPIVLLFIVYYLIQRLFIKTSCQLQRLETNSRVPILSFLLDTFLGLSIIKSNQREESFCTKLNGLLDVNLVAIKMNQYCNRWLGTRLELISNILMLICAIAIVLIARSSSIQTGYVGFILVTTSTITQMLSIFVRNRCEIENYIVSLENILKYCDLEPEKELLDLVETPMDWPNKGEVSFINFSCQYRSHLCEVLHNINFTVKSGQKVGIVGRTGSGKSSLLLSLFRMITKTSGSIKIDGIDIFSIKLKSLRSKLTMIPQDVFLFNGTLRDNLDPFKEYSDHDILKAIELGQLNSFINTRPEGLLYEIVENGSNIRYHLKLTSAGERQLICLTRALLKRTKILILDEATSNVDLKTDKIVQEIIRKEFSHCTVIAVAHRIETIIDYDKFSQIL